MGLNFQSDDENFDSENYVGVNERIKEFREQNPNGQITTFRTETDRGTSFKAVVFKDAKSAASYATTNIADATGHAFLDSNHTGEKVEEYTETAAIGRALAILGHKIEKSIASKEEIEKFKSRPQSTKQAEEESGSDVPPSTPLPKLRNSNSRFKMPTKKEE